MGVDRYPDSQMEFAHQIPPEWIQFADLREELLLDYGYNTARAYWADLQDAFEWAVARDKDVIKLSEREVRLYVALHRRRGYSENSIRRRITAMRLFYGLAIERGMCSANPAAAVVIARARRNKA